MPGLAAGDRAATLPTGAWLAGPDAALPQTVEAGCGHHAALGWRAMPAFYAELTARTDVAALGVRLLCLTAAVRLGEALLATLGRDRPRNGHLDHSGRPHKGRSGPSRAARNRGAGTAGAARRGAAG